MDTYIEELVKKNKEPKDYLLSVMLVLGGVCMTAFLLVLSLFASQFLGAFSQMSGTVGLLLIAGLWYLIYILHNSRSIEYEYIVINSSLDIDKIMAKKRRKKMLELDIKDATLMASVDDDMHNSVLNNPDNSIKVIDLSAKSKNLDTYFIDYSDGGKRQIVVFQPTSKMVEALWQYNPRAVKKPERV